MIDPTAIPALAGLTDDARTSLAAAFEPRRFGAGEAILRRGAAGASLFVVTSGLVSLRTEDGSEVALGPGQVFGEISAVLGLPVSATVRARKDTVVEVLEGDALRTALASVPGFESALLQLARSRHRPHHRKEPLVAFLVGSEDRDDLGRALRDELASMLTGPVELLGGSTLDIDRGSDRIAAHRACGEPAVLLITIEPRVLASRESWIERGDAVLHLRSQDGGHLELTQAIGRLGLGDHGFAQILERSGEKAEVDDRWHFRIPRAELQAPPERPRPGLARIARWVARRRIGLVLSAGAARGFAHLGVLAALEEADIPIDMICGTSIGGIVGLLYGLSGSADGARRLCEETIGGNSLVRRTSWIPRSSFFSGRALRDRAWRISEGKAFADLAVRVAVVTSDLVRGEQFVLDRGPVAPGLLATAAIPGALPPVEHEGRILVDGALVRRIPLELLDGERCGLRIAVNVLPPPSDGLDPRSTERWRARFQRLLGLRAVIGRSWEVLSWWKGANDAEDADVLIEPRTGQGSGFDFDSTDDMIAAGREACEEQLPRIRRALSAWEDGLPNSDLPADRGTAPEPNS